MNHPYFFALVFAVLVIALLTAEILRCRKDKKSLKKYKWNPVTGDWDEI